MAPKLQAPRMTSRHRRPLVVLVATILHYGIAPDHDLCYLITASISHVFAEASISLSFLISSHANTIIYSRFYFSVARCDVGPRTDRAQYRRQCSDWRLAGQSDQVTGGVQRQYGLSVE